MYWLAKLPAKALAPTLYEEKAEEKAYVDQTHLAA